MIPGIDAGNSRFKLAVPDAMGIPKLVTNSFGEPFTHSVVYFNPDGTVIVGTEALNAALADPLRAVFNWKRHMGTDTILMSINGRNYMAKDILAILLENAKKDLEAKTGIVVSKVVISHPANYTEIQEQETIDAAVKAGMEALLLTKEPTAAALGNDIHKMNNATVLVFDLGGGTFDVSILKVQGNLIETIMTNGDPMLGGQDFNNRMSENILEAFKAQYKFVPDPKKHPVFYQDLYQRVEQAKITMSVQQQCQIVLQCDGKLLNMTITRDQFNTWTKDLVERSVATTEKTLNDASLKWADIDVILLIGGGSAIPQVKTELEKVSGKKIGHNGEAMYAAAYGNVIAGRIECDRLGRAYSPGGHTLPPLNICMREILSHSIGVLVLNEENQEICSVILAKNTAIPSVYTSMFKLTVPNQTDVYIKVLEGNDGAKAEDCAPLGHFELRGMPPRSDLIGRIEISYHLDANGMLTATARDTVSGKTGELKIDYKNNGNTANDNAA